MQSVSRLGWTPIVFWACELKDPLALDGLFWRIVSAQLK